MKPFAFIFAFILAVIPSMAFASECPKPKESNGMTSNWIFDRSYIAASMNDAPYEECIRQAAGNIMEEGYYVVEYKCPTFIFIH